MNHKFILELVWTGRRDEAPLPYQNFIVLKLKKDRFVLNLSFFPVLINHLPLFIASTTISTIRATESFCPSLSSESKYKTLLSAGLTAGNDS